MACRHALMRQKRHHLSEPRQTLTVLCFFVIIKLNWYQANRRAILCRAQPFGSDTHNHLSSVEHRRAKNATVRRLVYIADLHSKIVWSTTDEPQHSWWRRRLGVPTSELVQHCSTRLIECLIESNGNQKKAKLLAWMTGTAISRHNKQFVKRLLGAGEWKAGRETFKGCVHEAISRHSVESKWIEKTKLNFNCWIHRLTQFIKLCQGTAGV